MTIDCTMKQQNLIVTVRGEIDHHTSEVIREKVDRIYEKKRAKNLIFDCSEILFMDSSGIGVLMGRYRNIQNQGGKMGLIGVQPTVDRIFKLSGIYKIIKKYDDVEQAVSNM